MEDGFKNICSFGKGFNETKEVHAKIIFPNALVATFMKKNVYPKLVILVGNRQDVFG